MPKKVQKLHLSLSYLNNSNISSHNGNDVLFLLYYSSILTIVIFNPRDKGDFEKFWGVREPTSQRKSLEVTSLNERSKKEKLDKQKKKCYNSNDSSKVQFSPILLIYK